LVSDFSNNVPRDSLQQVVLLVLVKEVSG